MKENGVMLHFDEQAVDANKRDGVDIEDTHEGDCMEQGGMQGRL